MGERANSDEMVVVLKMKCVVCNSQGGQTSVTFSVRTSQKGSASNQCSKPELWVCCNYKIQKS